MRHRSRRRNRGKGNIFKRIGGWFKRQGLKVGAWAILKEFQKKLGEQLKSDGKRTEIPVEEIRSWFPWNRKKRAKRHSGDQRGKG